MVRCKTGSELRVDDSECVVGSSTATVQEQTTKRTEDPGRKRTNSGWPNGVPRIRTPCSSLCNVGSPLQTMASGSLTLATACNTSHDSTPVSWTRIEEWAKSAFCKSPKSRSPELGNTRRVTSSKKAKRRDFFETILAITILLTLFVRDNPEKRKNHCSFVGSCPVSTASRHVWFTQKENINIYM